MKKSYIPFAAGMATMCLLVGLIGSSIAGETVPPAGAAPAALTATGQIDGKVSYGQAGVALFGQQVVEPGRTMTAASGAQVPTVLTYTDEKGGKTCYVAAETVAELLDVNKGAAWNEELKSVDFCPAVKSNIVMVKPGEEPKDLPENTITISTGNDPDDLERKMLEEQMATPTTPEYEVKVDTFTEIDPAEIDMTLPALQHMDRALFESSMNIRQRISWHPGNGNYILLSIKNEGESDIMLRVRRPHTVGAYMGGNEEFATVRVPAGQLTTRAFYYDENAGELQDTLEFIASSIGEGPTRISVTDEQFMYYGPRLEK